MANIYDAFYRETDAQRERCTHLHTVAKVGTELLYGLSLQDTLVPHEVVVLAFCFTQGLKEATPPPRQCNHTLEMLKSLAVCEASWE